MKQNYEHALIFGLMAIFSIGCAKNNSKNVRKPQNSESQKPTSSYHIKTNKVVNTTNPNNLKTQEIYDRKTNSDPYNFSPKKQFDSLSGTIDKISQSNNFQITKPKQVNNINTKKNKTINKTTDHQELNKNIDGKINLKKNIGNKSDIRAMIINMVPNKYRLTNIKAKLLIQIIRNVIEVTKGKTDPNESCYLDYAHLLNQKDYIDRKDFYDKKIEILILNKVIKQDIEIYIELLSILDDNELQIIKKLPAHDHEYLIEVFSQIDNIKKSQKIKAIISYLQQGMYIYKENPYFCYDNYGYLNKKNWNQTLEAQYKRFNKLTIVQDRDNPVAPSLATSEEIIKWKMRFYLHNNYLKDANKVGTDDNILRNGLKILEDKGYLDPLFYITYQSKVL